MTTDEIGLRLAGLGKGRDPLRAAAAAEWQGSPYQVLGGSASALLVDPLQLYSTPDSDELVRGFRGALT